MALAVTACGGDDSPSSDETPDNVDAAEDESSADAEDAEKSDDDVSDTGGGGDDVDEAALFEAIANGFIDAGSFEFESATSEGGQEMMVSGAMEVDSDGSFTNMRMSMNQGGVETTMLSVDGQFYMEMTEDMGMPGGEGWLTFGGDGGDELGQDMTGAFDDIGATADISQQLAENAELVTVTEVGSATVEGVETTEYHAVVNDIAAYRGAEGDVETTEMSFTMWLDGDNMVRRMIQESDTEPPIEMIYKNYGADVGISAPPEDEVIDFNEMMNQ